MRVTFISPFASTAGGIRVMAYYARLLSERGHEVVVVSQPANDPPNLRALLGWVVRFGRRGRVKPKTTLLDFLGDKHIVLERRRPVKAKDVPDADIVIATWWTTAEWVAALPVEKGKKYQLLQDYETFPHEPRERVEASYRLPLRKIAVSSYIIDMVRQHIGDEDIFLLPNALDTDQFDAPAREKNENLTVGFLYTLKKRKNVALSIQAMQIAKQSLPGLQARAFSARTVTEELPVPDWVEVIINPSQSEIPNIYASCDFWLLSSDTEGFGLPLLEAMGCRTPVLSTRAGAAPDLVDGANGLILESDAGIFSEHIVKFAKMSSEEWRKMSDAAHRTAHSYTWHDAADRLEAHLQATLD